MPRPEGAAVHPWCDGKYRCMRCPGGLGRGGRGFTRPRSVPCRDRREHMEQPDALSTADYKVHLSLIPASEEWYPDATARAAMHDSITQLRPSVEGWCTECERATEGTEPARKRRRARAAPPLWRHVGARPSCEAAGEVVAKRARTAQLRWCDGAFRCTVCFPKGQTRRLGAKRCSDPAAHMPHGVARDGAVHFLPVVQGARSQLPDECSAQLLAMARADGCERCRGQK